MKKGRETRREREKGRKTTGEESEWEKGRKKNRESQEVQSSS